MKNRKFQLDILKSLIREEIKLQKKKNLFEDVASTLDSALETSAMGKLGIPTFEKEYTTNGVDMKILNAKGYQTLNLLGFEHNENKFVSSETAQYRKTLNTYNRDYIQINWTFNTTKFNKVNREKTENVALNQTFLNDNEIKFALTYDIQTKTINLTMSHPNKTVGQTKRGRLHGDGMNDPNYNSYFTTNEVLDVLIPKNMKIQVNI
jgi:hypothetical protein